MSTLLKFEFDYGRGHGLGLGFCFEKRATEWVFGVVLGPFWWEVIW